MDARLCWHWLHALSALHHSHLGVTVSAPLRVCRDLNASHPSGLIVPTTTIDEMDVFVHSGGHWSATGHNHLFPQTSTAQFKRMIANFVQPLNQVGAAGGRRGPEALLCLILPRCHKTGVSFPCA